MGIQENCLCEVVLTSTHNLRFEQKYEKYKSSLSENFQIFGGKIFYIFEQACFHKVWSLVFHMLCGVLDPIF